jgi:putative flippase GtrA
VTLAIGINLAAQAFFIEIYEGLYAIPLSIAGGTGVGLIAKYIMDKKWIFFHQTEGRGHEAKTFALYTIMGLVTTLIFWTTEAIFHALFAAPAMRYLGGAVGLVIGYFIKYRLDLRHVFVRRNRGA